MRIVLDLQSCQSPGSRHRGIGRYSRALALAMLQADRGHEFWIALNGGLGEAVEEIRATFDGLLPQERIVLWDNPFPRVEHQQSDPWACRVAEVLREDFLHALQPDAVHVTSLFEGWDDVIATSIGRGSQPSPPTAVTLYDLIPLAMDEVYLQDPPTRRWYERKLEDLRRADRWLAISDFTRRQGMELLQLPGERIANISGSIDPVFRRLPADPRRGEALAARYGIWRPFVMYTGGFDPRKNLGGLIRAYASLPAALRERRQLAIVGSPPSDILAELQGVALRAGLRPDEVRFVGFVPDEDLVGLYNACELYVFPSRCEGFGLPALEAMACGAPVIAADATSLPEVVGYPESMFDPQSDAAMGARMAQALSDEDFRARLVEHGRERVRLFSWSHSAEVALDAMEAMVAAAGSAASGEDRDARLHRQSQSLRKAIGAHRLGIGEQRRLAAAQSENQPLGPRPRQLLVDVSNLVRRDAGTGIQRVVRNILRELPALAPAGWQVEPVHFDDAGVGWYARDFGRRFLGAAAAPGKDGVIDARPGDLFLGLDLSAHIIPVHLERFERLRRRGVGMVFVVYDLIPLLRPDCVNPVSLPLFHRWYEAIGELADGLCCISRAVADDLAHWCDQGRPARRRPLRIGHFHLGADMDARQAMPADASAFPFLSARPTVLMVGTIEPRKGYAQALAAAERLWERGADINLAMVGQPGWLMEDFAAQLRTHAQGGLRLHWFDTLDDEGLRALYEGSTVLLAASEAEGFGLPLVEAARHGLPILARDLPVFREVAGGHAAWFDGYGADALADALQAWLAMYGEGRAPASAGMPVLDWTQSARELLDCVLGGHWDREWRPGPRHRFPANDARLKRQVGAFDRQRLCTDGQPGFLVYGPYAVLPAGQYRCRVLGDWLQPGGAAVLDVVVAQGVQTLAHRELEPPQAVPGRLAELELVLAVDATDLEVRLWVDADARLAFLGIELEVLQPDPILAGDRPPEPSA